MAMRGSVGIIIMAPSPIESNESAAGWIRSYEDVKDVAILDDAKSDDAQITSHRGEYTQQTNCLACSLIAGSRGRFMTKIFNEDFVKLFVTDAARL